MGAPTGRRPRLREQGIALLITLVTIAILAAMVSDLHETTGTGYAVAASERDALQAEYVARSGLDLTRLMISQEPAIRAVVQPLLGTLMGNRQLPQFPVWNVANSLLRPFCNYDAMVAGAASSIDFMSAQGLADLPGTCAIVAFPENSKINLNHALRRPDDQSRLETSRQLFTLMGGYQSPSRYDALFQGLDPDRQMSTRLDIVNAVVDWWDLDTTRHGFDPGGNGQIVEGGSEDDIYWNFRDRYRIKNAPFDSYEEIRLVRGMSDDFWATFVEPDPDDPRERTVTIYGVGAVNPNLSPPNVLLSRLCSFESAAHQPLCIDAAEQAKFGQLIRVLQQAPIPIFVNQQDFVAFVRGQGDIFPMLLTFLGAQNPLIFRPLDFTDQVASQMYSAFVPRSQILTIQSTGVVGRTRVRIRSVVNFDPEYRLPTGLAGTMPALGVFFHYRID